MLSALSSFFASIPPAYWLRVLSLSLLAVGAGVWLRRELTPARFLTLFESEGVLSIRLVLAASVVGFTLCMEAAGRISDHLVEANFLLAATLLGLGTAKIVGKAFAKRAPEPAPQIRANTADINAAGDVNFSATPTPPTA